jgi:selenide,water dikinase
VINTPIPDRQLLLAGGGHSHALVLRRWAMQPGRRPAGCLITLVSRTSTAFYSGMVPGLVAGIYAAEDCAIDLRRLCRLAGVSFVRAEIIGLDGDRRSLLLESRPPLAYDLLSLDLGAETAVVEGGAVAVKPLEPFLRWCGEMGQASDEGARRERPDLRIVGGGAAAVELALALQRHGKPRLKLRGEGLHLGSDAANRCGERLLQRAAITAERNGIAHGALPTLACTGSRAPAWLAASGLPVDPATGRLLTNDRLQVEGHPELFASGDCAVVAAAPRPASGVWAVRAAPVLAANLERHLANPSRPLRRWRPQRRALQLLGDGGTQGGAPQAVAFWGPFALGPSPLLWRWKNAIDRRFMAGFTALGPMGGPTLAGAAAGTPEAMACRGCGAKLAAGPLRAALERLDPAAVAGPEDAAVVGCGQGGETLLQSVDGFPALVEDPWLNGRLTTLHACSDLWACGAQVASAQALVTLPRQVEALQEELLLQTLAGVRSVLDPLGARLVGGHTLQSSGDGQELTLALTVNGAAPPGRFWAKGGLKPGDALVLSRPIGTGVLFAAAQVGAAPAAWIDAALAVMEQGQAPLVELLARHGCRSCTDITGFGLLGHLGEMVEASRRGFPGLRVTLDGHALPALPGALELLEQGFASSLAPANAAALDLLGKTIGLRTPGSAGSQAALEALLIDPQTCGPLLAALPAEAAAAAVEDLHQLGFPHAAVVGRVVVD